MSRSSSSENSFTRRKAVAGGLMTIVTIGWFLSSLVSDLQKPTTSTAGPTPVSGGSGTEASDAEDSDSDGSDTGYLDTEGSNTGTPGPQSTPQSGTNIGGGSQSPEILLVSLLSEWNGGDQMEESQINSIARGEDATIGYRYRTFPDDGEIQLSVSVSVAGRTQNRIVSHSAEASGPTVDESASSFQTSEWSTGTKQAKVVIRDSNTGYVSAPAEAEFEVTDD